MNRRQTVGSRPRSIRLSSSACTTTAFSVAPSITPRGCLAPAPSTPTAASSTRSSTMWMPSIWMTSRSSFDRSEAIHSFMRSADSATNRRDAADLDRPAPSWAGTSLSGRRTARPILRVDTLISIRFSAHLPSQSSATAASQLGSDLSPPSRARTRGRSNATLPPWKPSFPLVRPQRCPSLPSPRPWRSPHSRAAPASIIPASVAMPAVRQNRSKLAPTCCQASSTIAAGKTPAGVVDLFMALLSFEDSAPRAYRLQGGNAYLTFSTSVGTSPSLGAALAIYLTYDLARSDIGKLGNNVSGWFFASPKPANQVFADRFQRVVSTYSVVNWQRDLVPNAPPLPFVRLNNFNDNVLILTPGNTVAQPKDTPTCNHHAICYAQMLDPGVVRDTHYGCFGAPIMT